MSLRTVLASDLNPVQTNAWLVGSIAPRPIAFASTINEGGLRNLAPFSFFNAFGSNPPMLAFAPNRRGRDGSTKHTYQNVAAIPTFNDVIAFLASDVIRCIAALN